MSELACTSACINSVQWEAFPAFANATSDVLQGRMSQRGLASLVPEVAPISNQVTHSNAVSASVAEPTPSWDFSFDVLDGFEQYMDVTPNVPAASYAAQGFSSAPSLGMQDAGESSSDARQLNSLQRKQHKNKLAQKRYILAR